MPFRLIPQVLFRAPLLPMRALGMPVERFWALPLGRAAVGMASESLAESLAPGARPDAAARAALDRYRRRAAFRPTPSGLLAGVGVGTLGPRTRLRSGKARAHLWPSWARLSALGRALLDEPVLRPFIELRIAPSTLLGPRGVTWLAYGEADEGLGVRAAEPDAALLAVLQAAETWVPWPSLAAALEPVLGNPAGDGVESLAEYLLLLVDQGLLCHDLEPPLVGDFPPVLVEQRLARFPASCDPVLAPIRAALRDFAQADRDGACARLTGSAAADPAGAVAAAQEGLELLPGAGAAGSALAAALSFEPRGKATFARAAFERAAALAPFLLRLQSALNAPLAERALDPALRAMLEDLAEREGAGAFSFAALASGQHGVRLDETDGEPESLAAPPPGPLLSALAAHLQAAAATKAEQVVLDPAALAPLLPEVSLPATFEIFATPAPEPARAAPGTGWLLGLHAPAGASFGRFVPVLGEGLRAALEALVDLEKKARPGALSLDVAYAASPAHADLSCHPQTRAAALALTGWPQARTGVVVPADLRLCMDPGTEAPLGLAWRGTAVEPSPLERVRSTTAPPGLWRLLAGWSFCRQHAPWAFSWGPLANLPFLPRVVLAGFVVCPRSWRAPAPEVRTAAALARWRRSLRVPRFVQVGSGDELLCLDLQSAGAAGELLRLGSGRIHEIWPPLGQSVDADGRRVEVVALVADLADLAEQTARARHSAAVADAGAVLPPGPRLVESRWTTFRIYGLEENQDAVLFEAIAPTIAWAQGSPGGDALIDRWFFLRYRDPATGRPHLRLRIRRLPGSPSQAFEQRLRAALADRMGAGDVTEIETAGYLPETARYRGPQAMAAVEAIFEAGSALVLELLSLEHQGAYEGSEHRLDLFVRVADALAGLLGLDLPARLDLAERRRSALLALLGGEDPGLSVVFRARGRALVALLEAGPEAADPLAPSLGRYGTRIARLLDGVPDDTRAQLALVLPDLLHLEAVRLLGPHRAEEQTGTFFWLKALKSVAGRQRTGRRPAS